MKRLVVGILAHVDAGKTTLSEAMLYRGGCLRRLGRVDHQDSFLDTETLERERGITIFSKQARLPLGDIELQMLDTPGHVDFSAEMERTLQVLDCAVLVVSGTDGVQGHTRTLWRLLARYRIPTFLFGNKMDLCGADPAALLRELRQLDAGCVDFGDRDFLENVAMCDEDVLARYLDSGTVADGEIAGLIAERKLFPCWFGSALRLEGVDAFLRGLERYARCPDYPAEFGAKVYKIARDRQGGRLTYLKVTGGALRVKAPLTNRRPGLPEEEVWEEKADQIRIYSGAKYQTADEAPAGTICAVTGLSRTRPGDGLGIEPASAAPLLSPVMTCRLVLPDGCDPHAALAKLSQLEDEDPQLRIVWDGRLRQIRLQLMGEVQLQVLQRLIRDRFGMDVSFGAGRIVYHETIAAAVEGAGHFEPLRHYAEVHLLLEPGERGSGLQFDTVCPEDRLDRSWQRLILAHLQERPYPGVLTGSPITDLKITLTAGRAHVKHTEGGDFRQAVSRAVRQGLMQAESVLLEPWYAFRLELPAESVGRALSDLQRKSAAVSPPAVDGGGAVLTGTAPVSELRDYAAEVTAYTRGRGRLFCTLKGYEPCHDQAEAVAAAGYDPERDVENTPDSVFCAHGASFTVRWDRVREYMHVDSGLRPGQPPKDAPPDAPAVPARSAAYSGSMEQDRELRAIFERTYGPVRRRDFLPGQRAGREDPEPAEKREIRPQPPGEEYLLVDGYNIIFAWDELKAVARDNLDAARKNLMDLLSNYQGFRKCVVILVFDAYRVPHSTGDVSRYHNIYVVYTRESQTADAYIERATYTIGKEHRVRVATSDGAEQLIILGHNALRVPASAFREEVASVEGRIAEILARNNRRGNPRAVKAALERAQDFRKREDGKDGR
jgi:small GTP-binding protein